MGKRPLILFDLDGTLIDTFELYVEAYIRALIPHFGRRITLEELRELKPRAELRFFRKMTGKEAEKEAMREFIEQYEKLHPHKFEGVYPGIPEMLSGLRERNIPLGILTGKSRPAFDITATHCDLGPMDVELTDSELTNPKPHQEGVEKAMECVGADPEQTWYIGDSDTDKETAKNAGVSFGAALWSKNEHEREKFQHILESKDKRLDAPSEVLNILDENDHG